MEPTTLEVQIHDAIRKTLNAGLSRFEEIEAAMSRLQGEREALRSDIAELQRQDAFWGRRLGIATIPELAPPEDVESEEEVDVPSPTFTASNNGDHEAARPYRPVVPGSHADSARAALMDSKHPMTIEEIIAWISNHRRPIPGTSAGQRNTVYSAVWRRDDLFKKVPPGRWDLVDRPD